MNPLNKLCRWLFFAILVRFIVLIVMGIHLKEREKLPKKGPAIIVANHNSHLDTLVLISLFPLKQLSALHPVAAADYFLSKRLLAWFSQHIIGIIPIIRTGIKKGSDPLAPCYQALDNKQILILFPEGTRGEPEQLSQFKKGIAHIAEQYPHVPIIPVFMHGLGKSLPKGEYLLVPFICDIIVGDALFWEKDRQTFMHILNERFAALATHDPSNH